MTELNDIPVGYWRTKSGVVVSVASMPDDHIRNVIAMLTRKAEQSDRCTCSYYTSASECACGPFAQEALWRDPVFKALEAELDQRRRLAVSGVKP